MNWTHIIEHNRTALLRLVSLWFASVGLAASDRAARLVPRHVYWRVLKLLRPAESALRRLIVVEARGLIVKLRAASAAPVAAIPRRGHGEHVPAFPLFDPQRRMEIGGGRLKYAKHGPQLFFFDGCDPDFQPAAETPTLSPGDSVDARRLCGRMESLKRALEDIPKQARRMARVRARRATTKKRLIGPMRPGRPPGHCERGLQTVDVILRDCQRLALLALAAPDTS